MNSYKKAFIGIFVFVALASLVPFYSAKAATYNLVDVPCGYIHQQIYGYTTALCDAHITIADDTVDAEANLDVSWWIDQSGYGGIIGPANIVKFNGQDQLYNNGCVSNDCKRAWTSTITAPDTDGCYSVDVYYKWTAYGVYDYHYQIPYKVGAGCNAGAGNTPQPTVMANANPTEVVSGNNSLINYSSLNATSCHISKNNVVKAYRCITSGTYTTGALTSNTQYQIECGREGNFVGSADPGCSDGGRG